MALIHKNHLSYVKKIILLKKKSANLSYDKSTLMGSEVTPFRELFPDTTQRGIGHSEVGGNLL